MNAGTCALAALIVSFGMAIAGAVEGPARPAPLKIRGAKASSTYATYDAGKAVDGVISEESRWISQKSAAPAWIELDLGGTHKLAGIHLYSGYQNTNALQDFVVQFWRDGQWRDIPSATFENNRAAALAIPFDDTVDVTTDRLRLWITATHQDMARVLEVIVWPASAGQRPAACRQAGRRPPSPWPDEPVPLIYLNQSGFNLGKPKRFTAPTLADGTRFEVRPATGWGGAVPRHAGRPHRRFHRLRSGR